MPASRQIKSHEELLERAGVDESEWVVERVAIRTYPVAMKIDDTPHVVQLHYVGVNLFPLPDRVFEVRPVEFVIKRKPRRPNRGPNRPDATSLVFTDVHYPYQDDAAVDIMLAIAEESRPQDVICLGDLIDCEQLGRWPKDPERRTSIAEECVQGGHLLAEVTAVTDAGLYRFHEGNHEERLRRNLWGMAEDRKFAQILQLPGVRETLTWERQLGLDSLGWEFVPYPKFSTLRDKLVLIHGDKAPAKGYVSRIYQEKYRKSGLSGHTHRIGSYYHTGHDGTAQAWHEIGMLGAIRDDFTAAPNWQQGFVLVHWYGDRYAVEQISIHQGRAVWRGRSYGSVVRAEEAA
ncbi:MAG: metallophosphoesterase [Mycobacterium sp.]